MLGVFTPQKWVKATRELVVKHWPAHRWAVSPPLTEMTLMGSQMTSLSPDPQDCLTFLFLELAGMLTVSHVFPLEPPVTLDF